MKRLNAKPKNAPLRRTASICPVCHRRLPAQHVRRGGKVYIERVCPEHGQFSSLIWSGYTDMGKWRGKLPEMKEGEAPGCPHDCGICPQHKQGTCCVLLEVTQRCDMSCTFCFANGSDAVSDRPLEDILSDIEDIASLGGGLIQLSGGEPTLREDLPLIIEAAKRAGIPYVQLNTNGIRLGDEPGYAERLAAAGLSFVFMQFDGVDDKINVALRGRPLLEVKKRAIANCDRAHLGVTLVPMLVPRVNIGAIGDILRFAVNRSPAVRGVHFQPVSYFGRAPSQPSDKDRFTLDALLREVYEQSYGLVPEGSLRPSRCDHPMCGFHGDYIVREDVTLYPLHNEAEPCCCQTTAKQNREFVARRWQRRDIPEAAESTAPAQEGTIPAADISGSGDGCASCGGECSCGEGGSMSMDELAARIKSHGFTVTAMAFQDAWNLDIERLRRCSLHVYRGGRLIPFCANYIDGIGADE